MIKVTVIKRKRKSAHVSYESDGVILTVIIPQICISKDGTVSRSVLEMGIPADDQTMLEVQNER